VCLVNILVERDELIVLGEFTTANNDLVSRAVFIDCWAKFPISGLTCFPLEPSLHT
jgi:hypothetical protein